MRIRTKVDENHIVYTYYSTDDDGYLTELWVGGEFESDVLSNNWEEAGQFHLDMCRLAQKIIIE